MDQLEEHDNHYIPIVKRTNNTSLTRRLNRTVYEHCNATGENSIWGYNREDMDTQHAEANTEFR